MSVRALATFNMSTQMVEEGEGTVSGRNKQVSGQLLVLVSIHGTIQKLSPHGAKRGCPMRYVKTAQCHGRGVSHSRVGQWEAHA